MEKRKEMKSEETSVVIAKTNSILYFYFEKQIFFFLTFVIVFLVNAATAPGYELRCNCCCSALVKSLCSCE